MSKPTPSATVDRSLPTARRSPATPAPDPRFAAARKHADTARRGLRLTVAAALALGLELLKLKAEIGATVGRPSGKCSHNANIKWPELVAQETGFGYQRCQDFMKAAQKVRERLTSSRKKGDSEVRLIVQTPPAEWTDDDYDAFADHIGTAFCADTFKALMLDLFPPAELPAAPGLPVQTEFPFAAEIEAQALVGEPILHLAQAQGNPENFTRKLYDLPLDDIQPDRAAGVPHIYGLRTLSTTLSLAQDAIAKAIRAKASGATAP